MELLRTNTPVEHHVIQGCPIWVKREDLSSPPPGPPFSKMRGVVEHIRNRPEKVIGVLDTVHSQGGWAVARACKALGRKAVVYYPVYKADTGLRNPQIQAKSLGAQLHALTAGRSAILYHGAKQSLRGEYRDSYMMPNALKLNESVKETAREVWNVLPAQTKGTWIVSASSATIASGVLLGLSERKVSPKVVIHLGYSRSQDSVRRYVGKHFDLFTSSPRFDLVDEGYAYKDAVEDFEPPFPCNPYYDRKALKWLIHNYSKLNKPILFWNIG